MTVPKKHLETPNGLLFGGSGIRMTGMTGMTKMTGPKAVRKKNNYFCDVDATSARRWYWGRYHHGTKTNNFFLFFRARLRLVILVILVISAGPKNRVCWMFCSPNEDAKQI